MQANKKAIIYNYEAKQILGTYEVNGLIWDLDHYKRVAEGNN